MPGRLAQLPQTAAGAGRATAAPPSDLAFWFSDKVLHPKPSPKPAKPKPALTMADLPPACKTVLDAPAKTGNLAAGGN